MKPRIAVIGAGIGGLSAAGLLARAGCEVVLFEAQDRVGGKAGRHVEHGLSWDLGPTLLTMPQVVRELFAELGATERLPQITELPVQCEYRYPNGRTLTVHQSLVRTVESAAQIHAVDAKRLPEFYATCAELHTSLGTPYLDAPYNGVWGLARRTWGTASSATARALMAPNLDAFAARYFESPELRQFVGRFATYAGASPFEASASFVTIAHVEQAFGVHHVQGGIGALVGALERAVLAAGVELRLRSPARWERDGAVFRVGDRREPFDAVIVNADPLVHTGREGEALALSGLVLRLSCRKGAPLPHHLILFGEDPRAEFVALSRGEAPDDPTVYVCRAAATDSSVANGNREPLFAMVNAPARWGGVAREVIDQLAEHALNKVRALPGVRELTLHGQRTPEDLERLGAPGGSIYGFLPRGRLGPLRRPRIRSSDPGLFFVGGGTHPGGGVPLVMRSGQFAASLALQYLDRRIGRAA